MTNKERVTEMYNMIAQGKGTEAFDQFYHPEVVMIEPGGMRCEGKEANRNRHQEWFAGVESFNGSGVEAISADEDNGVTMVECWNDISFKGGQGGKMEQIARQRWKDGQLDLATSINAKEAKREEWSGTEQPVQSPARP